MLFIILIITNIIIIFKLAGEINLKTNVWKQSKVIIF